MAKYLKPIKGSLEPFAWCYVQLLKGNMIPETEIINAIIMDSFDNLPPEAKSSVLECMQAAYPQEYACMFKEGKLQDKAEYLKSKQIKHNGIKL